MRCVCGCVRKAYNIGINRYKDVYLSGKQPSIYAIRKWFNSVKDEKYPYFRKVTKFAYTDAFARLEVALARYHQKKSNFPRYKRKGVHDRFTTDGAVVKVQGRKLYLPRIKWLRMTEELRFTGKIVSVTVSERAKRWYASINVEIGDIPKCTSGLAVGVSLNAERALNGDRKRIVLSTGHCFEISYLHDCIAVHNTQKQLARKVKGSKNWKKTALKLQKKYDRLVNARKDATHKATTAITKACSIVCLEDVDVHSMVKNKLLARWARFIGFAETKRQFKYKAGVVVMVGQDRHSQERCSHCGHTKRRVSAGKDNLYSDYYCPNCKTHLDLSYNAAKNILREGLSDASLSVCPRTSSLAARITSGYGVVVGNQSSE